ncbi:ATP-binding cassette domain-containing protein [Ornithinimicrobium humiphilum]|uniref:Monosaccharide ABC transporter ATP-binding protein (CUT2 family) n=1 Tax=Ornithinimicrobium humiphilum TaxID=125288 RepID=A0A543KQH6_9MICO|nr:ATP-binding cassette domain-containing protein [Ornithinimicrobium humiphilum]TQM97340.1 monosaccharide ABC transporter ATP-binding protein (CUT2 family) [Ornithinimicrobium humiphilum]
MTTPQTLVPPRIQMKDISKSYGMVTALQGVNLEIAPGEVVGIVGDNGAGKSTLMKVLAGTVTPGSGEIYVDGELKHFSGPKDAKDVGIEMVYQDLALCDDIDVPGNLFLGREPKKLLGTTLDREKMLKDAKEHLSNLNIRVQHYGIPVRNLSGGQRQAVAIARALTFNPRLLILDEPTSALAVEQVRDVLRLIKETAAKGVSVILITHRLQDLFEVCDRLCVMYEGSVSSNLDARTTSLEVLVEHIVGRAAA